AVIDRTRGASFYPIVEKKIEAYNQTSNDPQTGKKLQPRFVLESVPPSGDIAKLRLELSERVRKRDLAGFLEIGPDPGQIRFQSNRPTRQEFPQMLEPVLAERVQEQRSQQAGMPYAKVKEVVKPVRIESKGLTRRDPATGEIVDATDIDRIAPVMVP